jgi:hypothetical protein
MAGIRRRSRWRLVHSVPCRVLLVALPLSVTASQRHIGATQSTMSDAKPPSIEESSLRLTARSSRTQDLLGLRFGIYADLENTSRIPLFLNPRYLTLTSPPELTYHDQALVKYAYCPGPPPDEFLETPEEKLVRLDPGGKITCFWIIVRSQLGATGASPLTSSTWFHHVWFDLRFSPGQYNFIIVANYWVDPVQIPLLSRPSVTSGRSKPNQSVAAEEVFEPDPTDPKRYVLTAGAIRRISTGEHKTESYNVAVNVAAAEWVVLLGAMLGGVFAYALVPTSRLYPNSTLKGIFSAILLSTIATILLSRLSETQFVIRVAVTDLWGAVAIGFVAGATGRSVLEKFLQLFGKSRDNPEPS